MAVKTMQVTMTGSAVQISATSIKCRWASFFNTAAAAMRLGDANVSSSRGVPLAASTGSYHVPVNASSTYCTDLSQWNAVGTSTQVLDVVYDDIAFTA